MNARGYTEGRVGANLLPAMVNPVIRILLLSPQPLLGDWFQVLLSQRPDLAVVGTERDLDRAIECARALRPDVVITNSRDTALDSIVLRLLKEGITPVVIVLNMTDHRLRLYRSEEWQVNDVEDLEQAIRAEPVLG